MSAVVELVVIYYLVGTMNMISGGVFCCCAIDGQASRGGCFLSIEGGCDGAERVACMYIFLCVAKLGGS